MSTSHSRVAAAVPTQGEHGVADPRAGRGGQFAAQSHAESGVTTAPEQSYETHNGALCLPGDDNHAPINVRVVHPGDAYGLNGALTNDGDEAMVEFYDARYPHTVHGRFVSRYTLSTLNGLGRGNGLMLDSQSSPECSVRPDHMEVAMTFANVENMKRQGFSMPEGDWP